MRGLVRTGAVAGVVAPVIMCIVVVWGDFVQPGHTWVTSYISELGAPGTEGARITNPGFLAAGLLGVLFSLAVARGLPHGAASGVALAAAWASTVGTSLITCSAGCPVPFTTPRATPSDFGHMVFSVIEVAGLAAAPALAAIRGEPGTALRRWCGLAGVVAVALAVAAGVWALFELPAGGAVQRSFYVATYAWTVATAIWLLRHPSATAGPALA